MVISISVLSSENSKQVFSKLGVPLMIRGSLEKPMPSFGMPIKFVLSLPSSFSSCSMLTA